MLDAVANNAVQSASETKGDLASQRLADDLNQFLNLLVTQLENQDPLDPLDPNEFTSQLVQFASVEQQIYQNQNLEDMLALQRSSLMGDAVSYIGAQVEVNGNQLPLENGIAQFKYKLEGDAKSSTIMISDESGQVVFFTQGETDAGTHDAVWPGLDNFGFPLDDGVYTVNVSAVDVEGKSVNVDTNIVGTVKGVSMENGEVLLSLTGADYKLDDVISVRGQLGLQRVVDDPDAGSGDGASGDGTGGDDTSGT
ncbi:MAG: flagellar hook capping FlgD N-terminal domain-containing protein [Rhodospirillales bacterium]